MTKPGYWTRRQFSQALGAAVAASRLGSNARAQQPRELRGFAFIGSSAHDGTIHCFRISGPDWHPLHTVAAAAPLHLEPHPTLPILYAVHTVGLWENLPRGAVSAYRLDSATGRLILHNTQPLSLAATYPRHAAVSPDGHSLLVAASGGGIYNLLPIAEDGSLQPPSAIRKEVGGASPGHVLFHPNGTFILTADAGQKTLNLFSVETGELTIQHRIVGTHTGSSSIAYSPWSRRIHALQEANGSIAVHPLDAARLNPASYLHQPKRPGPASMALHPTGRFLVTSTSEALTALAVDERTGHLAASHAVPLNEPLRALYFTAAGTHLHGIGATTGTILQIAFNLTRAALSTPRPVARIEQASSLLFLPA